MTRLMQNQAASVVRERDPLRLRAMFGVVCLGGILVAGVLGYVWLQVQHVHVLYELDDVRGIQAEVLAQNRQLQLELASLRAHARVDLAARRLGLAQPAHDQVQLAREYVSQDLAAVPSEVRTAARADRLDKSEGRP